MNRSPVQEPNIRRVAGSDPSLAIVPFVAEMKDACAAILARLPNWFGRPESNDEYIAELCTQPTFVAMAGSAVVGFLNLRRHTSESWEINCMAVDPDRHRQRVGQRLTEHAEVWLRTQGVVFLVVMTLGPSHVDPYYARTRAFYSALGFRPLLESNDLWDADTPCLVSLKLL